MGEVMFLELTLRNADGRPIVVASHHIAEFYPAYIGGGTTIHIAGTERYSIDVVESYGEIVSALTVQSLRKVGP